MSRVFVDTSAILALLVPSDVQHPAALTGFEKLRARDSSLVTSSYVLVETYALLSRRFGLDAVRSFREDFAPLLDVTWVDGELHDAGLDHQLAAGSRSLSLVDATSMVLLRRLRIDEIYSFDRHFTEAGFQTIE